ncbi:hypothetical protein STEG23_013912, partial [Scotinomys teguina]
KGDTGSPGLAGPKGEPGRPGLKGDAGMKGDPFLGVRIVGGTNRGRAEVYYNNVWGTICDDGWDNNDATVFCRMLGYSSGRGLSTFGGGSGNIWLDNKRAFQYVGKGHTAPQMHLSFRPVELLNICSLSQTSQFQVYKEKNVVCESITCDSGINWEHENIVINKP